jgi:ribonuclease HII
VGEAVSLEQVKLFAPRIFAEFSPEENHAWYSKEYLGCVGVDEAGRGPLVGPVVAACVILPAEFDLPWLTDSKKLSEKKREALFEPIQAQALAFGIGMASATEIDEMNILNATFLAMRRALEQIDISYEHVLVDGNHKIREFNAQIQTPVIKGDSLCPSIAAASILAKVSRDRILNELHSEFPMYDWIHNKGYGTPSHVQKMVEFGPCVHHRKSFKVKSLANL